MSSQRLKLVKTQNTGLAEVTVRLNGKFLGYASLMFDEIGGSVNWDLLTPTQIEEIRLKLKVIESNMIVSLR